MSYLFTNAGLRWGPSGCIVFGVRRRRREETMTKRANKAQRRWATANFENRPSDDCPGYGKMTESDWEEFRKLGERSETK